MPAAPVALVLGARVFPDGTPSPFLAARLDLAHRLYQAGKVRVVLVSGDNMAAEYNEPDAMRGYLIDAGMPPEAVVADYAGFDTYDSCARAKRIFGVEQLDRGHPELPPATGRGHLPGPRGGRDRRRRRPRRASTPGRGGAGRIRDQLACVKTVIDLMTGRDPVLGPRDTSVRRRSRPLIRCGRQIRHHVLHSAPDVADPVLTASRFCSLGAELATQDAEPQPGSPLPILIHMLLCMHV